MWRGRFGSGSNGIYKAKHHSGGQALAYIRDFCLTISCIISTLQHPETSAHQLLFTRSQRSARPSNVFSIDYPYEEMVEACECVTISTSAKAKIGRQNAN